jgi:hypothetical protein
MQDTSEKMRYLNCGKGLPAICAHYNWSDCAVDEAFFDVHVTTKYLTKTCFWADYQHRSYFIGWDKDGKVSSVARRPYLRHFVLTRLAA